MQMTEWETGVYYDRSSAEEIVERLRSLGYDLKDISILMSDERRKELGGDKAAEGAVTGAVIGGGLSAILAALTATGSFTLMVGTAGAATPFVAGPLAAALVALGAGGGAGGIIGALVGAGLSREQAAQHEQEIREGGIVIGVRPRVGDRERVRNILSSQPTITTGSINAEQRSRREPSNLS